MNALSNKYEHFYQQIYRKIFSEIKKKHLSPVQKYISWKRNIHFTKLMFVS